MTLKLPNISSTRQVNSQERLYLSGQSTSSKNIYSDSYILFHSELCIDKKNSSEELARNQLNGYLRFHEYNKYSGVISYRNHTSIKDVK